MAGVWDLPSNVTRNATMAVPDLNMASSIASGMSGMAGPAAAAGGGLSGLMAGAAGGPITMGLGMVASYFAAKDAARQQKKTEQRQAKQRMNEESYSKSLDDWYKRRDKADWRNGAGNFKQFSTVGNINPNYVDKYKAAEVGKMPTSDGYIAGDNKKTNAANNKMQQAAGAKTLSSYGGG